MHPRRQDHVLRLSLTGIADGPFGPTARPWPAARYAQTLIRHAGIGRGPGFTGRATVGAILIRAFLSRLRNRKGALFVVTLLYKDTLLHLRIDAHRDIHAVKPAQMILNLGGKI